MNKDFQKGVSKGEKEIKIKLQNTGHSFSDAEASIKALPLGVVWSKSATLDVFLKDLYGER